MQARKRAWNLAIEADMQHEIDELKTQRDDLLEALRAALPVMEARAPDFNIVNDAIRAAIAKATE